MAVFIYYENASIGERNTWVSRSVKRSVSGVVSIETKFSIQITEMRPPLKCSYLYLIFLNFNHFMFLNAIHLARYIILLKSMPKEIPQNSGDISINGMRFALLVDHV